MITYSKFTIETKAKYEICFEANNRDTKTLVNSHLVSVFMIEFEMVTVCWDYFSFLYALNSRLCNLLNTAKGNSTSLNFFLCQNENTTKDGIKKLNLFKEFDNPLQVNPLFFSDEEM